MLDEALVLVASERQVELHVHGSTAVVGRVRQALGGACDVRADSTLEQRAEELLTTAASEVGARLILAQVEGALRSELERLAASDNAQLLAGARLLAERGRATRWFVRSPRVVLAGPVNAGKSTLFNLLVGRERVVVGHEPGTTRDAVRERVRLGALVVELFDTAGERADSPAGSVEQAGQDLARELRASADLVLWLAPAPAPAPPPSIVPTCVLHTCADRDAAREERRYPSLSVLRAPQEALARVVDSVCRALGVEEPPAHGTPVPLEDEMIAALALAPASELRGLVRGWLNRDPATAH
jgi:hypothetical protein